MDEDEEDDNSVLDHEHEYAYLGCCRCRRCRCRRRRRRHPRAPARTGTDEIEAATPTIQDQIDQQRPQYKSFPIRSSSSYGKITRKFRVILFVFVFSNLRWAAYAEKSEIFDDSRVAIDSMSSVYEMENFRVDFTPTSSEDDQDDDEDDDDDNKRGSTLKRRIRHDTTKNTLNERLISFESAAFDSITQKSVDDGDVDRFLLKKRKFRRSDGKEDASRAVTSADRSSWLTSPSLAPVRKYQHQSCRSTCFDGTNKLSRVAHDLTITLQHRILDTSHGIFVGVTYQVFSSSPKMLQRVYISSENATNGLPIGVFYPSHKNCSHVGQLGSETSNHSQILLNWSLPSVDANSPVSTVLFRVCYQLAEHNHTVYEALYKFAVIRGCEFAVQPPKGSVSWTDLFASATIDDRTSVTGAGGGNSLLDNCSLSFANIAHAASDNFRRRKGLMVKLTRLNVRCGVGYVQFLSDDSASAKICGKFEEIELSQRQHYFEPTTTTHKWRIVLRGKPTFAFTYELVDICYNVSLHSRNDSVVVRPLLKMFCNYKISLPYGNRIDVSVTIGRISSPSPSPSPSPPTTTSRPSGGSRSGGGGDDESLLRSVAANAPDPNCGFVFLRLWHSNVSRVLCRNDSRSFDVLPVRLRWRSDENELRVRVFVAADTRLEFALDYEAVRVPDIVGNCAYGSVSANSACVSLIDNEKLDWMQAEQYCLRNGGHLVSVLDEQSQQIIDRYLMKSPSYQDSNSYWIGASDIGHEGDFHWTDDFAFSYSNWFNGWPMYGYYNRQPNDDGFSSQDCVELRRQYHVSPADVDANGSKARLSATFTWNDRDCSTKNYFLCESFKLLPDLVDKVPDTKKDCNLKVALNEENGRVVIASPSFPRNYPDNKNCLMELSAPSLYKLVVVFEEFVLEDEPNCDYDYLEIFENSSDVNVGRFCGDWSDKLKLLRYLSSGSQLFLRFNSDYSHTFSGFKAYVYIEQVKTDDCPDKRLQMFHGSCYLFVSYPQVTWQTAQDICIGVQADLASVRNMDEHHFIVSKIRESHEYTTSAIYWLGGRFDVYDEWKWIDNTSLTFNAWIPMRSNFRQSKINNNDACLGIQWVPSPSSLLPSGLYWVPISCQKIGGYVCKIKNQTAKTDEMNLNVTANGVEGELSSANYPGNYYHNLDYWMKIESPENTRIIIQFQAFDLEEQKDCLYDYLEICSVASETNKAPGSVRNCGHHHSHLLHRLNFVSTSNRVILRFHSDYSVAGSGFVATWKAVDISGCPAKTLTAKEAAVTSPNYPHFLLANLQCTITILAPVDRRVWFEITDWDFDKRRDTKRSVGSDSDFYLSLSSAQKVHPFQNENILTDGVYLSYGEYMRIHFKTGDAPNGRGFEGVYKTAPDFHGTRVVNLGNNSSGQIYHLNFPLEPVAGLNFVQRFVAPLGYSIHMQFYQVIPSFYETKGRTVCPDARQSFIEVRDHYADRNGTWWQFCEAGHPQQVSPLAITSYLNSITIKQFSNDSGGIGVVMNASITVVPDANFKTKISQFPQDYVLESCHPNPCNNNGKCVSIESEKRCECADHFTGLFCALTICDVNPCVFGVCELTRNDFKCACQQGYQGKLCDKKVKPCSTNPCEGRGECIEKNNFTYFCQCHAWWEGDRCEKKIANIPYKPLTDRMLEEPFWLGLLTVFVVLSIIGLVWCARRHFPEKLEKLLAEEAERNRHYVSSGRSSAMRADLMCHNGAATAVNVSQTNTANSSPNPRTLLGRLGIRKPSLFSLTSPLQPTHTARTFSLDDLFKPSSSRSQMSYKHRNSSTGYRKKSTDKSLLKKQSCSTDDSRSQQNTRIEIIELNEENFPKKEEKENKNDETSFIFAKPDKQPDNKTEINNKYEKKVHFARLMSKVQAEMVAGSDTHVDVVRSLKDDQKIEQNFEEKPLTVSTQTLIYQLKSPHSTSSNQGSDSLSSSEMTLITASGEKLNSRRPSLLTLGTSGKCQKAASADSILAMFRKFSFSTAPSSECNSNFVSASTSPTISSPQEEVAGSDDSSLSSYPIPSTPAVGTIESPPCTTKKTHSSTIQVSVLDPLGTQKTCANIPASNLLHPPTILLEVPNKCLSPIHEVPTPSPSPSMTPIMSRHQIPAAPAHLAYSSQDGSDANGRVAKSGQQPPSLFTCSSPTTRTVRPMLLKSTCQTPSEVPTFSIIRTSDRSAEHDTNEQQPESQCGSDDGKRKTLIIPSFTIQGPSPMDDTPVIVLHASTPPPPPPPNEYTIYKASCTQSPPTITVTCTGETDSDPDCVGVKCVGSGGVGDTSTLSMAYLSPFSVCSRADRTASESNLSSSGYSSMASPSPSRCGSNNALCPSEVEDHSIGSHRSTRSKPSLLCGSPSGLEKSNSNVAGIGSGNVDGADGRDGGRGGGDGDGRDDVGILGEDDDGDGGGRGRSGLPSDSETLSDDHQLESNDEGFDTDRLDDKIQRGDVKSAKELELFMENQQENQKCCRKLMERRDSAEAKLDNPLICSPLKERPSANSEQHLDNLKTLPVAATARRSNSEILNSDTKADKRCVSWLQLPSIVVNADTVDGCGDCDRTSPIQTPRSPLSSRSESPLSDRTANAGANRRFSPMFYGRLTDSDGTYDCTSSDCLKPIHRKHFGRRRERHRNKSCTNSKAKNYAPVLLDVPGKVAADKWRKPSTKRRIRSHMIKASSSSSASFSSSSSSSASSTSESAVSHQSRIRLRKLQSSKLKMKYSSKSSSCSTADDTAAIGGQVQEECASAVQHEPVANHHLNEERNNYSNVRPTASQRFNIIEKLSSILSNDKKHQWKNTNTNDSASIPLLIHSHSVEENQTNFSSSKRHYSSKHGKNYYKSSGLTD